MNSYTSEFIYEFILVNDPDGEVTAQRGGRVVDGEDGVGQPHVPVVLAAVGEGPERVAQNSVDALSAGVGVLVVRGADQQA